MVPRFVSMTLVCVCMCVGICVYVLLGDCRRPPRSRGRDFSRHRFVLRWPVQDGQLVDSEFALNVLLETCEDVLLVERCAQFESLRPCAIMCACVCLCVSMRLCVLASFDIPQNKLEYLHFIWRI